MDLAHSARPNGKSGRPYGGCSIPALRRCWLCEWCGLESGWSLDSDLGNNAFEFDLGDIKPSKVETAKHAEKSGRRGKGVAEWQNVMHRTVIVILETSTESDS